MSNEADVFEQIREASAEVARRARFVRLVDDQISPYAASLAAEGIPEPVYDPEHHAVGTVEDIVAFLITLDTVNFGSGYFPHLRKRPGMSGYYTVASALKERWEHEGPLSGADLRAIDASACATLFGQEGNEGPAQELMGLFAQALNDLGMWLGSRYDDDPLGPIEDAGRSAATTRFTTCRDALFTATCLSYHDFRSRSTNAPRSWLRSCHRLQRPGTGRFYDADQLTIFADNLVPHVLRVDGLLAYDPDLLRRIEQGG